MIRVGLMAGLTAFAGVSVTAQTLTDALISAYRNSVLLEINRAGLRATDESVAQAWAALRPTLSLRGSSGYSAPTYNLDSGSFTHALNLDASLKLWDGGANYLAAEVARLNVSAARQTLIDVEQSVMLNAVTAFMDMRRDTQFLALSERSMHVIERQVQAARDRFEVGDITRTEVSQAESRLASAVAEVALRQGNLEISREVYHIAVGVYPGELQPPPPLPDFPNTLQDAQHIGSHTHPSILRAQHVVKASEFNVLRAEASTKLNITLSGNINVTQRDFIRVRPLSPSTTSSITLGGSLPIYSGGALSSAYRQALAIDERSRFELLQAGKIVSQNVARFWALINISRASIVARHKQVRASRVALRGVQEEANFGARTTLDVLDAERELLIAESNLVAAQRDEAVAIYSLLSTMGLLTVKHLGLGIATYNTDDNYNRVWNAPVKTERGILLKRIFKRAGRN